jgi:hypothetical protein
MVPDSYPPISQTMIEMTGFSNGKLRESPVLGFNFQDAQTQMLVRPEPRNFLFSANFRSGS